MIGIIVTGHGNFASGLESNLNLIIGNVDNIIAIDFEKSDSPDSLESKIDNAIEKLSNCSGIILFTDLLNGTPFNVAIKKAVSNQKIRLVYGVNAAMLLELSTKMSFSDSLDDMVNEAIETGKQQIGLFTVKKSIEEDEL
ncbi:MAG: PTS sugar transporter subunit IIA [Bacillota bacterium]|nr:PTS sugar transporter subunit IIA [Erysipelotrichaceae bacterium]MDO5441823.1 PTS sugar transporter subunit IIA [Bacillota bacterium]